LLALCVAIYTLAEREAGHGAQSTDARTYLEMMVAIWHHGLPCFANGPVDQFAALEVPWNVSVHGRLCGTYPPLYPYLMAPLLQGGLRMVAIATYATLIPVALVSFELARRTLDDEWYALLAAAGVVFSTPLAGNAFALTAYPLAVLICASSTLLTMIAVGAHGRRRYVFAAIAGALFAAGSATHLLCFPIGVALIGVLCVGDVVEPTAAAGPWWVRRTALAGYWPTRETLSSGAVALVAMVVCLLPVAWLNHLRFDSYNPLSYGPAPWRGAEWSNDQKLSAHLRYAAPTIVAGTLVVAAWLASSTMQRRKWPVRLGSLVLVAAALVVWPVLRERTGSLVRMATYFIVDLSVLQVEPPYRRIDGGFGQLLGPWVLKSTLQCTPLLGLVLVPPGMVLRDRHRLLVLLAPAGALYASLVLRANLHGSVALGWSWVYLRYTLPALPMLFVAALMTVRELRPRPWMWAIALVVATTMLRFLAMDEQDDRAHVLERHLLLLALPIGILVLSAIGIVLRRRGMVPGSLAAVMVMGLVGTGFGVGFGHDFLCGRQSKTFANWKLESSAAILPQRFAVFGTHWAMEQILFLRVQRDIESGDTVNVGDMAALRPLIDHWMRSDRPVYFVAEGGAPEPVNPWPDIEFKLLSPEQRIYHVLRTGPDPL